ncbi:helix-turn-helix domain-containing protein [Marinitenerispora sediminis]|uniref:Transcriptional regulator n=1 Tax=Marinitenerispora sediminis TaxID=1931232 RepID=A0A368T4S1_9ACTN|nr:helix-turn-helix transcriptional regulator [Marinitenerispora sediminis]RCV50020.1 transcriptional regulator [Marinitenerispora sediminis]RCV54056.1 transcriptional regulator [Marinitenerispora sediminis]RCV58565.1 transcriptional regulator [Marinitenerispora sediminis]
MSTDFQRARLALGAQLRELRIGSRLTGREMAAKLGWAHSKISKLENGRQTATADDLTAWASACGQPDAEAGLQAALRGLETRYRTWRRQLAGGHRARQEVGISESNQTRLFRGFQESIIPGLFQTAEYARHIFLVSSDFHQSPRDTEEAVRARIRRQELLYDPGRQFRFLVWEAALRMRVCPPDVMAGQLDRLSGLMGLDTVELGIIPFAARLKLMPSHGFWIYDERLVVVENLNAEMWLDDAADIALYVRAWERFGESAVYGPPAHRLIASARAALETL